MHIPKIGEVLRHRETGNIFEVRKITSEFVILHAKDGRSQIMTGKRNLSYSFEKIFRRELPGSSLEKSI